MSPNIGNNFGLESGLSVEFTRANKSLYASLIFRGWLHWFCTLLWFGQQKVKDGRSDGWMEEDWTSARMNESHWWITEFNFINCVTTLDLRMNECNNAITKLLIPMMHDFITQASSASFNLLNKSNFKLSHSLFIFISRLFMPEIHYFRSASDPELISSLLAELYIFTQTT